MVFGSALWLWFNDPLLEVRVMLRRVDRVDERPMEKDGLNALTLRCGKIMQKANYSSRAGRDSVRI